MTTALPTGESRGALLANVMHFARALRAAGMPIGPCRVVDAIRAIELYCGVVADACREGAAIHQAKLTQQEASRPQAGEAAAPAGQETRGSIG